jgi:hypothetical protein
MSLNSLNLNNVFPSNLNGLAVITTTNGGGLPVTSNAPIIETTTTTAQNVKLYESATDYINFATYNKALEATNLVANTGAFTSITATNETITNSTITNLNTTNMTGTKASITNLTFTTATGTNAYLTNATIGNLTIAGATIPYLNYTTATGTNTYSGKYGLNGLYDNVLTTAGGNLILANNNSNIYFRPVSNTTSNPQVSIDTLGRLVAPYATFGDEIVNNINCIYAITGSTVATSSTIRAGGILSTTSGQISNGNSTWTTNSDDIFLNANTNTIYLRPKGQTANPADGQVYLGTNGSLICTTGTLTAWNGYFNNGLNAPNANITSYGLTSSYLVSSPSFTGANYYGGTFNGNTKGNVSVTNPQKMYFYESDGTTECMRIEPGAISNVLTFYCAPYGSIIQAFLQAGPTGASLQYLNNAQIRDYVYSPNAQHDAYYTTTKNGTQTTTMSFYNDTSAQSRPFNFYNRNQSAYIKAFGSNSYNNGFVIGDTTAERWFIYNQAGGSTLAFNNNSSDLVTLNSSSMNITPLTQIYNTLNVGASNFGSNALINLGYTGTLGGTLNSRQGYVYMDGSYMVLNNQQYNNNNRNNSTIGHIQLTPANGGAGNTTINPNGSLTQICDAYVTAGATFTNNSTGGYGVYINKPYNSSINNYYNLVIQGNSYSSAITMHAQVSGIMSNITLGATNYPYSNDALTIRPYSTSSQDTFILIANDYQERNGKVYIGQNGTGGYRGSDAFIQNWSNNANGKLSGIYFQTDTANQGVGAPAQYIDYTGQTFFNPYTLRSGSNSQAGSALSVIYGFKSLPQVGTLYTTSRGAGNYVTWHKALVNNATYTVAGGIQKIALTDGTSVNASPWQTTAGARQYTFRADWTGVYDLRWNLNLFCTASTNCFIYVYVNGVQVMTTIAYITAGNFSYCNGTKLFTITTGQDVYMAIQPDVNSVTIGNYSTIDCIYVG